MTLTDSERAAIRARVDVYIKAMVRLGYTPKPAGISEWIGVIHSAPDDLLALLNEVDALRAALEFYADMRNHQPYDGGPVYGDEGEIARKALGDATADGETD